MIVSAIIESLKGTGQKYVHDPSTNDFKLKRELIAGLLFPFDFGFIPGTLASDGDPLDIMIISEKTYQRGEEIECRLIGGLAVEQTIFKTQLTIRNDRLFGVPLNSVQYSAIGHISDLPEGLIDKLGKFFIDANQHEKKSIKILKVMEPEESASQISSSS